MEYGRWSLPFGLVERRFGLKAVQLQFLVENLDAYIQYDASQPTFDGSSGGISAATTVQYRQVVPSLLGRWYQTCRK